jgi:hypothetical protein
MVVSDREAYQMATRYLATLEHKFAKWMQDEGRFLEPHEREEMRSNVQNDEYDLARGEEYKPRWQHKQLLEHVFKMAL